MTSPLFAGLDDKSNYGNFPGDGPLRPGGVAGDPSDLSPQKDENLPSTVSQRAAAQQQALRIVRDCAEGALRIRNAGEVYLPRDVGETPAAYQNRLKSSDFFEVFGETVEALTGLVFAKDPVIGDDVPEAIVPELENIDNAGTHFDVFMAEILADALVAGHSGILVEFPQTDGKQTAADEKSAIRPYWVPILKDNIVSWRTAVISGKTVLSQLVIKECGVAPVGLFGEQEVENYRVLFRDDNGVVGWKLLHVNKDKTVTTVGEGVYQNQDEIPFAEVVTSGRKAMLESKPPLLGLAFKNLEHYRLTSDRGTSIHATCAPVWVETGIDPEPDGQAQPIVLGPRSARRFTNAQAKAGYQSHDGAALGEVTNVIAECKTDMAAFGLEMLAPSHRGAETAEAKRIDKASTDSKLGKGVRGLQDGAERALYFHARYKKLPDGGSVAINRDFENNQMDAATMTAWGTLAQVLGLPVLQMLEILRAGGRFDKTDQELQDLANEIDAQKAAQEDQRRIELQQQLAAKSKQPMPGQAA